MSRGKKQEIKLMVNKLKGDEGSRGNGGDRVTIENSSIGLLQSGGGNVARVESINFAATDASAISEVLRQIRERIDILEISEREKTELREVTSDVESEIVKEQPNGLKLNALIAKTASTIRTLVAMKDLYAALAPYLPALGVHLPPVLG